MCWRVVVTRYVDVLLSLGEPFNNLVVTVGPHLGSYKRCGSDGGNHVLETFTCPSRAYGVDVKIVAVGADRHLTLCEVVVFGQGTI